jgi:DNA repair exonuclease SbcCD ATPase subunit
MYIFGGRTEEGADLGDLAAFRITSRRWYTFQNMGPSPSPRSGHSMTAYGKQVVVLAGEPSTATREASDLAIVYLLDTSKIRYPNDQQIQQTPSGERVPGARRPSTSDKSNTMGAIASRGLTSRDGSVQPDPKRLNGPPGRESVMGQGPYGRGNGPPGVNGNDSNGVAPGSAQPQGPQAGSKLPRASIAQSPPGPPPQQAAPTPKPNGTGAAANGKGKSQAKPERGFGPTVDTSVVNRPSENVSPLTPAQARTLSPTPRESPQREGPVTNGIRSGQTAKSTEVSAQAIVNGGATTRSGSKTRSGRQQSSVDSTAESPLKTVTNRQTSPPPPSRQPSNPLARKGSARNSQTVALLKELDAAKNRNQWYASELELARKAGYVPNPSSSPMLDQRAAESFDDDDKPLIEALIAMKTELSNVQASIDKQAVLAAKKIAEVEKQRDAAVSEAVYAKAKLAAHSGSQSSTPQPDSESRDIGMMSADRSNDISKKLASALAVQRDLKNQVDNLTAELDAEKRGRQLAEDTSNNTQSRIVELEAYKQKNSSIVETLRAELHDFQMKAREESIICAEAVAAAQILEADKKDLETQYKEALGASKEHSDTFESLRDALSSSADMRSLLERKIEEERVLREKFETKLNQLKAEHETRTSELETVTRKLRDAEELAEQHANEARTHKKAVYAGLDKVATRDLNAKGIGNDERLRALQGQVQAANGLVRKYQAAADAASEKLRSAEGRIAGLEAYQEQASREGMSIRKQLQSTMREVQTLQATNSDMKYQLANQQLETNAVHVQHNTLKDILGERGISPSSAARSRGLTSPLSGSNTPEPARLRELEQQLAASTHAHDEMKTTYEKREQEAESAYREKLSQLENDYQSAVHYVKGTEKMLKRMKDELAKYKSDNARMKEQLLDMDEKSAAREGPATWEQERADLNKQIESLQAEVKSSVSQLERQMAEVRKQLSTAQQERDGLKQNHEEAQKQLSASSQKAQADLAQLEQENALLEQRAQDAEQKVTLLLDQLSDSVDNHRRQSQRVEPTTATHSRHLSGTDSVSETSLYEGANGNNRNSMALDSLANELENLRSHWETTNKNYRLSNTFDFEERPAERNAGENKTTELSSSLADWRKRLDQEEEIARSRKNSDVISPGNVTGVKSPGKREMSPGGKDVGAGGSQINLV